MHPYINSHYIRKHLYSTGSVQLNFAQYGDQMIIYICCKLQRESVTLWYLELIAMVDLFAVKHFEIRERGERLKERHGSV